MAAITSGPELVKLLRRHGTGESKLRVAREEMDRIYAAERRFATPGEIIAVLIESGASEITIDKARQLAETGEYKGPPQKDFEVAEDRYARLEAEAKQKAAAAKPAK